MFLPPLHRVTCCFTFTMWRCMRCRSSSNSNKLTRETKSLNPLCLTRLIIHNPYRSTESRILLARSQPPATITFSFFLKKNKRKNNIAVYKSNNNDRIAVGCKESEVGNQQSLRLYFSFHITKRILTNDFPVSGAKRTSCNSLEILLCEILRNYVFSLLPFVCCQD